MTPHEHDVPADLGVGPHQGEPGPAADDPVSAEDRAQMGHTLDEWLHADSPAGGARLG